MAIFAPITIPPTGYGNESRGFGPGTGTNNVPSLSSGDYFGLTAFNQRLFLPDGYVSGTPLSNSSTWNNRTLENLGLAPAGSTFIYSLGTGENVQSLTVNIAPIPEPSFLIGLTSAAACAAMLRVRMRRLS